ncbi:hypothetical protein [Micromonospora endolithica]|uniref:Uncharacterized protein n=1 Tax=Micromonospora endolithica TaxID=230091 RepID=A0A3A9ZJK5_9ACTN|nr:hypothetical protein [Micromonospora endolithica]RKN48521.1 hypothetical protein D7223_11050 [Micromonospora endolithica]TWJ24393.1 hypothetical protein JD76_04543 [Micromonospora endolithica]
MDRPSTGEGPYSRNTMRLLAISSVVLAAVVAIRGLFLLATGGPNGTRMLVIGLVLGAVTAAAVPLAKHRGRM